MWVIYLTFLNLHYLFCNMKTGIFTFMFIIKLFI